MLSFRLLLLLQFTIIVIYTLLVVADHGYDLLSVFFGDIFLLSWPGQFNLDFLNMLMLSALWVAWRHDFSAKGLGLGALALVGGIMFLSIYLLVITHPKNTTAIQVLIGEKKTSKT